MKLNRYSEKSRLAVNDFGTAFKFVLATVVTLASGCSKPATFSLLGTSQNFSQSAAKLNNQIDILWVVDNSGSMDPLQQNLVANFNSFVTRFQALGFDYKMAVTTTDSYLSEPQFKNNPSLARVRDGYGSFHTGFNYITPFIPNIVGNFVENATQGSGGSGDERAFSSLLDTLTSPVNSDFHRPGAFLAVIILSDEDDFTDPARPEYSWMTSGGITDHNYVNPNLITVDQVVGQLDALTASKASNRQYNVSTITVMDEACRSQHAKVSSVTIVGQRYIDLATKTSGIVGSICDQSYADSLNFIQQRLVELTTQFPLNRQPNPSTITVMVDNVLEAQDPVNGWTYNSVANTIVFHGTGVPTASSLININFDPATLL